MNANLSLVPGRLFSSRRNQGRPDGDETRSAVLLELEEKAERLLRSLCREGRDVLSPSAWSDLRNGLSRFLEHLLLLKPDSDFLQDVVRSWVEAQHEMVSRLNADRKELGGWLSSNCGQVSAIETDLSDRHGDGRTVAIFTFESGARVVYKPRAMGIEDWYCRFAGRLRASGMSLPIRAARVIIRSGYGWMEFVPHVRCQTREELGEYYRKAGALLCVLHLLRARDCHFQNLIANGTDPVLVDAEMLFQPQLDEHEPISVVQTGMIPSFRFGPEGQHYDVSALGFVERKATHYRVPEWSATGVRYEPGVLEPRENVPFPAGEGEARPKNYVNEMIDGFTRTYHFLASHDDEIKGFIRVATELPVRYLMRETMEYYEALQGDLINRNDGAIPLPAPASAGVVFSGLEQEERAALARLDIPRFVLAAGERSLPGLDGCFLRSGVELALAGIEELSEKDLARQIQHIRLSWSLSRVSSSLA